MNQPDSGFNRWAAVVLASALLLGACTGGGDDGAAPASQDATPESTAEGSVPATFESPDADDFYRVVASRDDLGTTEAAGVLSVDEIDARTISVAFEMESHECHGITASALETVGEIIVDVQTAPLPERSPADCVYGVFPYATVLELAAPVAERTIVLAEEREPEPEALSEITEPVEIGPDPDSVEPGVEPDGTDPDPDGTDAPDSDPQLDRLVGLHIEDGVEWAINNERPWRLISQDGVPVTPEGVIADGTIGFVVEADLIVSYEVE